MESHGPHTYIMSFFFRLIKRLVNVNNRVIAVLGLSISLLGTFLMADWQSIPYDPCTELSLFHHPELADDYNNIESNTSEAFNIYHDVNESVYIQELQMFEESVYNLARNKCEEANIKHHCHWIPSSPISKEMCSDCQPICRSVDRTLNFVQFLIGAIISEFSQPVARITFTAIVSDQVRRDLQVCLLFIIVPKNHNNRQSVY